MPFKAEIDKMLFFRLLFIRHFQIKANKKEKKYSRGSWATINFNLSFTFNFTCVNHWNNISD